MLPAKLMVVMPLGPLFWFLGVENKVCCCCYYDWVFVIVPPKLFLSSSGFLEEVGVWSCYALSGVLSGLDTLSVDCLEN